MSYPPPKTYAMKKFLAVALLFVAFAALAQTEINPKIKPDRDKEFVAADLTKKFPIYNLISNIPKKLKMRNFQLFSV